MGVNQYTAISVSLADTNLQRHRVFVATYSFFALL